MIPEAAVEAALNALGVRGPVTRWVVSTVLESAAPHISAAAWEQGAIAGWKQSGEGFNAEYPDESTGECSVDLSKNPYAANYGCPDCGDADWACDCRWRSAV